MAAPIIRRACMYIPASSPRMLSKTTSMVVDTATLDLEDSVAPHKKAEARDNVVAHLTQQLGGRRPNNIRELCVRINSVDSGLALDDLTAVLQCSNVDAIMLPKCDSAADLHFVTDVLRHVAPARHSSGRGDMSTAKPPVSIIALIESARAVTDLREICGASPYLSGLVFAAEDFAKDMSLTRTAGLTEFLFARSAIATAARAARLPSTIDLVCTEYRGEEGLRRLREECVGGKGLGFNGKQCIHPSQVEICHQAFSPGEEEVEWSVRVVVGDEKAGAGGRGAWTLDGKMIDVPVVKKARAVLRHAEACGVDVEGVKEKWKDQEPE